MDWSFSLLGLFAVCFLASSLYPLGSEAFVLAFLALDYDWVLVCIVATFGNTLGTLSTYGVGYLGDAFCQRKCKAMYAKIHRYANGIQTMGFLYAFLTFLPIVGDIFALALGVYRYSFIKTCIFVTLGKGARYLVLIMLWRGFSSL